MTDTLRALNERIGKSWEAQKSKVDDILAEGRAPSPEEREQIERMDKELDELDKLRQSFESRQELVKTANALREQTAPQVEAAREERREPTELEMLEQMVNGERRGYVSNFTQTRALGDTPDGGTAVPTTFADFVSVYQRTMNPTIDVATVINTPDNKPLVIPRLTADAAGGGTITAEGGGITLADSTISAVTLLTYKYASIQVYSSELARSNVIALENLLARTGGRQIGLSAGAAFTTGDGTDDPNGFVTAGSAGATASGTAATGNAFDTFIAWPDLVDLYMSVVVPWRMNGSWQVSNDAMAKIRKFRDANGLPIYDPMLAGRVPTVLGAPIYENPGMAAVASASSSVAFGDFSEYIIRQLPLRVDISDQAYWGSDSIGLRIIYEADADLMHSTAVRTLVSADT